MKTSPSLMCMDFLKIREQLEFLNTKADMYHADIMDLHFVPNITLSPDFIKAIRPVAALPIDAHLMTDRPELMVELCAAAGADYISPHVETINGIAFRTLDRIEKLGKKAGIAINPETPLCDMEAYIGRLEKITVMTVDPGFSGSPFIPEVLPKIETLAEWKAKKGYKYTIEIDGACNKNYASVLKNAGAEMLIVGTSGLFGLDADLPTAWKSMQAYLES